MVNYDPGAFPPFAVTVDLVVLTLRGELLNVLLVKRGGAPYADQWALPGGFVQADENLVAAADRELVEETGISGAAAHMEQVATYGEPDRDPRMRVVSVAYLAILPNQPIPVAATDAADAEWRPVEEALAGVLAFDHDIIFRDALERARAKLEYSPMATAFCPDEFTVAELRHVYEIIWGRKLDPRNFHRKVTSSKDFLVPTGRSTVREAGRPAQLFRAGTAQVLYPPLTRSQVA